MGRKNRKRGHKTGWPGRLLMLLPAGCVLFYPLYLARQLDTVEKTCAYASWPKAFDGLKIVFLSDIHYGTLFSEERVRQLVSRVNALEPDVILLGGDYGEDSEGAVDFFALHPGFRARLCVLAAVGNHDRTLPESNLERIMAAMREDGVIPLVNDVWTLEKDGQTVAFAGVDDHYNGAPDLEKVRALSARADFTVFIPHTPDILPETLEAPGGPFYDLALCGHTHGGQVTLFGHSLHASSDLRDRYRSGWYHEGGADILVSNGVGTSVLPVRLGARAQIHVLVMVSI